MSDENWDEYRIAYQVARMGTVSAAAEVLGIHHATVIRHVDALEARIGTKLFQRHARGYTPTASGEDLMRVMKTTEDQFLLLAGRLRGQEECISGQLVVTSLERLSPLITPALAAFQAENPNLIVKYLTGERLFKLEYGEAHVAIRTGSSEQNADNVVQPLTTMRSALCASRTYVDRHGPLMSGKTLSDHLFVGEADGKRPAPFNRWLWANVPEKNIIFRSNDHAAREQAIHAGIGIGFVPHLKAQTDEDLIEVMYPRPEWDVPLWVVTHVDLHRSNNVQAFTNFLKNHAKSWSPPILKAAAS